MKVYIVTDDICCCGIVIKKVFSTEDAARIYIASKEELKYADVEEYEVE